MSKDKKRFQVKMYPALAMLIVRGAITASDQERQEAQAMIMAGPRPEQDYFGGKLSGRINH